MDLPNLDKTGELPVLSIARMDIERLLGFPAGRFTQSGPIMPLLGAIILTIAFYAVLIPWKGYWINDTFTQRSWIPYVTVLFSFWALMIVFVKARKVSIQWRALSVPIVPKDVDFVLSSGTVTQVLDRLHEVADDPRQFLLLNRIQITLSNFRNMGRIGDVGDVLRSQAENDEAMMESSYTVVRGLIWTIPVLGFIGTVLGLSQAIGAFSSILTKASEIDVLKPALREVTGGLSTAFETTLHALIAAVVIQLLLTMVKRSEERMLDEFQEYCQRNIVGRLRMRSDSLFRMTNESANT